MSGPLTPPLARKGPQGLIKRPTDKLASTKTKSMATRHDGSAPSGNPSKTPRAGKR